MTRLMRLMTMLVLLYCGGMAHAQEEGSPEAELATVPQALAQAKFVNKVKPDLKAKLYFVYQSRSTCGICVQEAPALVKEYKRMKRKGCEMVMLNVDASPAAAEQWVRKAKMTFPVMCPSMSMRCGIPWIYTGRPLLPCMIAVKPDGTKVGEAGGPDVSAFVKNWRKLLREVEKEEARKAAAENREKARAEKKAKKQKKAEPSEESPEEDLFSEEDSPGF